MQASTLYLTSANCLLRSNDCLDVRFPNHFQWELPSESVHFSPASKPTLIDDPANGLQAVAEWHHSRQSIGKAPLQIAKSRLGCRHVLQAEHQQRDHPIEFCRERISPTCHEQTLTRSFQRPTNRRSEHSIFG